MFKDHAQDVSEEVNKRMNFCIIIFIVRMIVFKIIYIRSHIRYHVRLASPTSEKQSDEQIKPQDSVYSDQNWNLSNILTTIGFPIGAQNSPLRANQIAIYGEPIRN